MKNHHFIYKTTCLPTNKIYVGKHSTDDVNDEYFGSSRKFRKLLREIGEESFKREILEFCKYEELEEKEKQWIKTLNSTNIDVGYNQIVSGSGGSTRKGFINSIEMNIRISNSNKGKVVLPSTRRKMSRNHADRSGEKNNFFGKDHSRENNPMFGKHQSEENRQKHSLFLIERYKTIPHPMIGKHLSDDAKETISIKAKERYTNGMPNPFQDKHHSEESKLKISNARKNLPDIICPYCGLIGKHIFNMTRYHFDNCKKRTDAVMAKLFVEKVTSAVIEENVPTDEKEV